MTCVGHSPYTEGPASATGKVENPGSTTVSPQEDSDTDPGTSTNTELAIELVEVWAIMGAVGALETRISVYAVGRFVSGYRGHE